MNQNKLTFQSENLVIDYISFNITGCKDPGRIANCLSDSFVFNSVVKETFQGKSEYLETGNERIFRECSINPQTGKQDDKSVLETRAVLQAKREGLLTDVSRPKNPKVVLDFEVKGLGRYENITHADGKTPASLQAFQEQGIKPSGPDTYSKMGKTMGEKLVKQKARFCCLKGGPDGPENVLHIIDFRKIPTYTNKSTIATHFLDAAERAGNTTENILFLNFE